MRREALVEVVRRKRSLLCVGLDTEAHLVPRAYRTASSPVRAFEQAVVEATHDLAVAYKLNLAFYEARGEEGWADLRGTVSYIRSKGDCLIIADAKRGDIGNTARKYAEAFFDTLDMDAVTLSPYMGRDSVEPFLGRPGKWGIVLAATSNPGAADLQFRSLAEGGELFEEVVRLFTATATSEDLMFVVGATRPELLARVRALAPGHFLLVPGVGAQGGDLDAVLDAGMNADGGLLINSSRGILYAGKELDAIPAARKAAQDLRKVMEQALVRKGVL